MTAEMRYVAPGYPAPRVGDLVICRGVWTPVQQIVSHAPNTHRSSPIRDELTATEYRTSRGSRWCGVLPQGVRRQPMTAKHILDYDTSGTAAAEGWIDEIHAAVIGGRIVIGGSSRPGDALHLRPGAAVVVLGEDEYRELRESPGGCPLCDERASEVEDLEDKVDVLKHEKRVLANDLRDRESRILELEGRLADAEEQLHGRTSNPKT